MSSAGTEETTTGVIRLRSMAKAKALKYPIIAVNDAETNTCSITVTAPDRAPWMYHPRHEYPLGQ